MAEFLSKWVENTVGKGEIACYEQFLLFPQCFQKAFFPGATKGVIVWEWVKGPCLFPTKFTLCFSLEIFLMYFIGTDGSESKSFAYLRNELLVRLANIMKEFDSLPEHFLKMPSTAMVRSW